MTATKRVMDGVFDTDIQKRLRVTSSRDIVRNLPGIVLGRRDACRDVFPFTFRNGYDIAPPLARIALPGRYDSYSRVYRIIVPNARDIGECLSFTVQTRFEVERERIPGQLYNRFDLSVYYRDAAVSSHDLIRISTGSGVADCVFGVWYSDSASVDVNRVPDMTVWYSPNMSAYHTTFERSGPAWVAVAVVCTGGDAEMGKVHELFLDWNTVPPQAPGDVTVLDGRLIETEYVLA